MRSVDSVWNGNKKLIGLIENMIIKLISVLMVTNSNLYRNVPIQFHSFSKKSGKQGRFSTPNLTNHCNKRTSWNPEWNPKTKVQKQFDHVYRLWWYLHVSWSYDFPLQRNQTWSLSALFFKVYSFTQLAFSPGTWIHCLISYFNIRLPH